MTAALVLQLVGATGFLAGVAALLHFLNTRKSTRTKGSAEAYQAYREFVNGAFEDADSRYDLVAEERNKLLISRQALLEFCQTLISALRLLGAKPNQVNAYQERLEDLRRL